MKGASELTEKQEKKLKTFADALHQKKIIDYQQEIATEKVFCLEEECLSVGIRIKDINKVKGIVDQWIKEVVS